MAAAAGSLLLLTSMSIAARNQREEHERRAREPIEWHRPPGIRNFFTSYGFCDLRQLRPLVDVRFAGIVLVGDDMRPAYKWLRRYSHFPIVRLVYLEPEKIFRILELSNEGPILILKTWDSKRLHVLLEALRWYQTPGYRAKISYWNSGFLGVSEFSTFRERCKQREIGPYRKI